MPMPFAKFEIGQCVATPGALAAIQENGQHPIVYIARHQSGDWGELSDNDKASGRLGLYSPHMVEPN